MNQNYNYYDRSVKSLNDSEQYEFSGESEYSRERSDPYQMVDYMIDSGLNLRGKGPEGFELLDEQIYENVCEKLTRDSFVDASDIEVHVYNGCVFLKGRVDSRRSKRLAELIVEDLPGVNDVINQLEFT
jgi:osmotically-inducible protein OsmY